MNAPQAFLPATLIGTLVIEQANWSLTIIPAGDIICRDSKNNTFGFAPNEQGFAEFAVPYGVVELIIGIQFNMNPETIEVCVEEDACLLCLSVRNTMTSEVAIFHLRLGNTLINPEAGNTMEATFRDFSQA